MTGTETAPELEHRLADVAARLLTATLGGWLAGAIAPVPQDPSLVTLTRPLRREDGRLDPSKPALELERQVRAYQPWPGSFIEPDGERLVVWKARAVDSTQGQGLGLQTSDGVLELVEVQPAGGRRMSAADYARGRPNLIGSRLFPH